MADNSFASAHAQDSTQNPLYPIESESPKGHPHGGPRTTGTWVPSDFDYINTHIRRGNKRRFTKLSRVAQTIRLLLCDLPGSFGTGWHGSIDELRVIYREEEGSSLSWGQINDAVRELVEAGFLKTSPWLNRKTSFCVVEPEIIASKQVSEQCPDAPIATRANCSTQPEQFARLSISVEDSVEKTATASPPDPAHLPVIEPPPALVPEAAVLPLLSREEGELVHRVRERFKGQIGAPTIRRLINETSLDNVARQLEWFDFRNNSWARRGHVAAFCTYCRQETGEPEVIEIKRQEEARQRAIEEASTKERKARAARQRSDEETYLLLLETLEKGVLEQIKEEIRNEMGRFFHGEETLPFQGSLRTRILAIGRMKEKEVIPQSS